jgi:hypothetical protein
MKYLGEKPQDATIYFAVGYLAYEHTRAIMRWPGHR